MLLIAFIIPLVAALVIAVCQRANRRLLLTLLLTAEALVAAVLTAAFIFGATDTFTIWCITDTLRISFAFDALGRLMGLLVAWGWLLVSIYSCTYMKHEKREGLFYIFLLLTQAFALGVMFSDNVITMYMFFEATTLVSFLLVLHSRSALSQSASFYYLFYSMGGAFLALFGIFIINSACNSLNFTMGGMVSGEATPLLLVGIFLAILGFGAKAGLYPLHTWLPVAHPAAPAPASALLSGLITKLGVVAIIRMIYFVVGPDIIRGTWVQTALIITSLITIAMGSVLALAEKDLKKRLAFSSVSQLSYILVGLFLLTEAGITGAVFQIIFHATVKIGLFMCAGALIYLTGKKSVDDYVGVGAKYPVIMASFTLLSLSLIGIPPFGGFFSKWYIAKGSFTALGSALSYIVPAVLLFSALITAAYLLPVACRAFFPSKDVCQLPKKEKEPAALCISIAITAVVALCGGVLYNVLLPFIENIVSTII